MPRIAAVRQQIEDLIFGKRLSNDGWQAIREAAGIKPGVHCCDPRLEPRLWAAAAIRLSKGKTHQISTVEVIEYCLAYANDVRRFVPGYVPIPDLKELPQTCYGRDLPSILEAYIAQKLSYSTLWDWCRKLGWDYSVSATYSGSQVYALIGLWVRMRIRERKIAAATCYQNFHRKSEVA